MRYLLLCLPLWLAATAVQANEDRYVMICRNGEAAGQGACPSQPKPGKQPGDWSCTRDTKTNLVWSLENTKGSWHHAVGDYPKAMNNESRCGFSSGWRLPTRKELLTILVGSDSGTLSKLQALWQREGINRATIDTRYFPETSADAYWAADSSSHDPSFAWFVYFKPSFDNEGNAYTDYKSETNYIRLVREAR